MYAVIKTGGKQYRVQAGDVLVVEKLDGDVGAEIAFDQVLMLGGEGGVTVGAPLVEGALVHATLIETRKGAKIKIFKKIRRQGYRRTNGHRQPESVLRVTGLEGGGLSAKWDGVVDMTPRSELVARARGLSVRRIDGAVEVEPFFEPAGAELDDAQTAALAKELAAPAKAPRTRKASADDDAGAMVEQPVGETPAAGAQTSVDEDAAGETGSMASTETAAKKPRAKKAKPADDAGSAE